MIALFGEGNGRIFVKLWQMWKNRWNSCIFHLCNVSNLVLGSYDSCIRQFGHLCQSFPVFNCKIIWNLVFPFEPFQTMFLWLSNGNDLKPENHGQMKNFYNCFPFLWNFQYLVGKSSAKPEYLVPLLPAPATMAVTCRGISPSFEFQYSSNSVRTGILESSFPSCNLL